MFDTVLVANRGEIAVPRDRARCGGWGSASVAVYSDADAEAPHVRARRRRRPDRAGRAAQSYLSIPAVIAAARATGAQAVHPGYGFLSENTAFAAACAEAGIVFVGPPVVGDRGDGRQDPRQADGGQGGRAGRARLGRGRASTTPRSALAVEQVGYPVLLKPSAGGGGKGMREVHRRRRAGRRPSRRARREARGSLRRRHAARRAPDPRPRGTSRSRCWPTPTAT